MQFSVFTQLAEGVEALRGRREGDSEEWSPDVLADGGRDRLLAGKGYLLDSGVVLLGGLVLPGARNGQ